MKHKNGIDCGTHETSDNTRCSNMSKEQRKFYNRGWRDGRNYDKPDFKTSDNTRCVNFDDFIEKLKNNLWKLEKINDHQKNYRDMLNIHAVIKDIDRLAKEFKGSSNEHSNYLEKEIDFLFNKFNKFKPSKVYIDDPSSSNEHNKFKNGKCTTCGYDAKGHAEMIP